MSSTLHSEAIADEKPNAFLGLYKSVGNGDFGNEVLAIRDSPSGLTFERYHESDFGPDEGFVSSGVPLISGDWVLIPISTTISDGEASGQIIIFRKLVDSKKTYLEPIKPLDYSFAKFKPDSSGRLKRIRDVAAYGLDLKLISRGEPVGPGLLIVPRDNSVDGRDVIEFTIDEIVPGKE